MNGFLVNTENLCQVKWRGTNWIQLWLILWGAQGGG